MMKIEEEIFKNSKVDYSKLEDYGFKKNDNDYQYSKLLTKNLQVNIRIYNNGTVKGQIIDLKIDDEYIGYRIENQVGEFHNKVLDLFKRVLIDIRDKCFKVDYFKGIQANRISNYIINKYGDYPEFLWDNLPEFAVFRNKVNSKWYGIIYNILKSKITSGRENVDAINVKAREEDIVSLKTRQGIYDGYHSNKKYWITIILDDTLSDTEIFKLIDNSYDLVNKNKVSGKRRPIKK